MAYGTDAYAVGTYATGSTPTPPLPVRTSLSDRPQTTVTLTAR